MTINKKDDVITPTDNPTYEILDLNDNDVKISSHISPMCYIHLDNLNMLFNNEFRKHIIHTYGSVVGVIMPSTRKTIRSEKYNTTKGIAAVL